MRFSLAILTIALLSPLTHRECMAQQVPSPHAAMGGPLPVDQVFGAGIAPASFTNAQGSLPAGMPPGAHPGLGGPPMHMMPQPNSPVGMAENGLPPGTLPWPAMSPFENTFQQHYNKDGLWHVETDNSRREYQTTLSWMSATLRRNPSPFFNAGGDIGSYIVRLDHGYFEPTQTGLMANIWFADEKEPGNYQIFLTGGGLKRYMSYKYRNDFGTIRPVVGLRYMFMKDQLNIGVANPNAGDARQESRTQSHLFGPEVGLRLEMGGDSFKMILESTIGLNGNFQDHKFTDTARAVNFEDDTFSVSPVWEIRFHVESNILQYVPYVKKMSRFRNARFKTGVSYVKYWEVLRAGDTITNTDPLGFTSNRSPFNYFGWDVGVEWRY